MEHDTIIARYVILIGINDCPDNPPRGCVRDVQEVKKYLEKMPSPVHIKTLTASLTKDSCSPSAVDAGLWPTYDNVTSTFKTTTSLAKPGDFVYIHYSGHGTSDEHTKGLALVLPETTGKTAVLYLKGLELAYLLGDMVEKKVTVTLVLDCCFSGNVVRKDSLTRFLSYDPEIDAAYPYNQSLNFEAETEHSTSRNTSIRSN